MLSDKKEILRQRKKIFCHAIARLFPMSSDYTPHRCAKNRYNSNKIQAIIRATKVIA